MTYPSDNFYPGFGAGTSPRTGIFTPWLARLRAAVEDALAELAYWRSVHETTRQLAQLDDAILRDIGLHRSHIALAARRMAQAKRASRRAGRRRPSQPAR